MTDDITRTYVYFECRRDELDGGSSWVHLSFTLGGSEDELAKLIEEVAHGFDVACDQASCAAVHARYVRNTETRIEQRGITAARLEALIGFMPGQTHLQDDLNASHAVHQDLRLHPLLVGRRQVPPENRQAEMARR